MRRRVKNTDNEEQLKDMECSVLDKAWGKCDMSLISLSRKRGERKNSVSMSPSPVVYKNGLHREERLWSFDPVFGLAEFFKVTYLSQYP